MITVSVGKGSGKHSSMQSTDYSNHTLSDRFAKLRHRFPPESFANDITRSFSTSPLVLSKTWTVTLSHSCCTPRSNQKHCIGTATTFYEAMASYTSTSPAFEYKRIRLYSLLNAGATSYFNCINAGHVFLVSDLPQAVRHCFSVIVLYMDGL